MKIHISAVILLFNICCRNPYWLSIIYFPKSKPKTWGGQSCYGEDLLYSRLSPRGKKLLKSQFSGGKSYYGGISRVLQHTKECGGCILTRILTGGQVLQVTTHKTNSMNYGIVYCAFVVLTFQIPHFFLILFK
jgi:hypothetical protein